MSYCRICRQENCKKHSILFSKVKRTESFSGSSPPEIFVGRWNYPNVYAGILSPEKYGSTAIMSSPELWHSNNLQIPNILYLRNQLIYGRMQTNIKKPLDKTKFLKTMREIAMTHHSINTKFKLKKPITKNKEQDSRIPLIAKAAPIKSVRLEENPKIKQKIDYLVNDTDAKSTTTVLELEKFKIETSSIIKLLSAGLLGLKKNRKLVPTRWAITATDNTISKEKLKSIRYYPEISGIQVFHSYYLGNHYEFLLLPEKFSFEVVEISLKSHCSWHDYETFFQRKKYAGSVTGAYYANRLALTEYLEKIKKQCQCVVLREIRPEYCASLGVGILRQASRSAFKQHPEKFNTITEALQSIQLRLKQPIKNFTKKSIILKTFGKQKRINDFF